ncbi:hypothetical protein FGO68_gene3862 [Halteria grandinella]|uniref:PAS domain-containing protein n=1 Tax=Halteria grandinella TaxID=5974 RepID=A0A8J8NH68_HALGN|nr:hypothetical protein FGO68_gene3862 [Halteria grandinella]
MGEIEQELWSHHVKQSDKQSNYIDITKLYDYNRAFLAFQKNEVLATMASLKFWRELQDKDFNASKLQSYGYQISKCLGQIQDAAIEIARVYPEDIKFQFRYGMFLIKIINNDFDGTECFKLAQNIYINKVDKRDESRTQQRQQARFEDNAASCFALLSTDSQNFCHIVHINDEVETIFGYKRKELLGENIRALMPPVLGPFHDGFVKKYLASGKVELSDKIKQSLGQSKDGYIFQIDILIKIYPKISGEIQLAGVLQKSILSQQVNHINQDTMLGLDHVQHMILTDQKGYVSNASFGMLNTLGLHPKFFRYQHDSLMSMIRLDFIAPTALDPGNIELIESDGMAVPFDTSELLAKVESEQLNHDEIELVRPYLKKQDFFVRMKKIPISETYHANLYILQSIKLRLDGSSIVRQQIISSGGGNDEERQDINFPISFNIEKKVGLSLCRKRVLKKEALTKPALVLCPPLAQAPAPSQRQCVISRKPSPTVVCLEPS